MSSVRVPSSFEEFSKNSLGNLSAKGLWDRSRGYVAQTLGKGKERTKTSDKLVYVTSNRFRVIHI